MKAKFKFDVGQKVNAVNGMIGTVAIAGVTETGVQYLVRNNFTELWIDEDQLTRADGKAAESDPE